MKVQLSCGALLEVNGFLCFPVSFTITKVNGDCLCLKSGIPVRFRTNIFPRSEYVSEIGTRKKGTTLSESRKWEWYSSPQSPPST